MTPEDREILETLRRQQADLRRSLERLNAQLDTLEAHLDSTPAAEPPPLPPFPTEHLPALPINGESAAPPHEAEPFFPPFPASLPPPPPIHASPPPPPAPFEFRLGRWLTAIGAVFGIFTLGFLLAWPPVYHFLGSAGLVGISVLVSAGVYLLGERLERSRPSFALYGRTISAMALAWLYLTVYAAHYYPPLCVIHSPLLAAFLLLLWSVYVLVLAERKKSQVLAVFSIFLAYVSSAIDPIGAFTMAADLGLALTAVVFLLRNGWATLSYFSLIGAYGVLLRRLVIDNSGQIVLDTSRALHFWPLAAYLFGVWTIFTAAVLFSEAASFRGGKRAAFLSLNNGGLATLLALAAHLSGYDLGLLGWAVLDCGLLLLATSAAARGLRADEPDVSSAYLAQGLFLLTTGIVLVYTGISRGVLLALETLFLGFAGAYSRNVALRTGAVVVALLATLCLIKEVAIDAHSPWLLGLGGALIMRLNAWCARADVRDDPERRRHLVPTAVYYCLLALSLVFTSMYTELSTAVLPPALALVAMGLTLSIYLVRLFPHYDLPELPPTAQLFLLAAQAFALFPTETGEVIPWWSSGIVSLVTLVAITWWTHQRIARKGSGIAFVNLVYSLAFVGLVYNALRPHVDAEGWLVLASLLSLAFLSYGALLRVWSVALLGQLFLGLAVCHFFIPPDGWDLHHFPWTWGVATVPVFVVFATGMAAHQWLRISPEIGVSPRIVLRFFAFAYQGLALLMVARWIFAVVPAEDQIVTFFLLGTGLLVWNVLRASAAGIRAGFFPTAVGLLLYLHRDYVDPGSVTTVLTGLAALVFLLHPALLRRAGGLVHRAESWIVILLSAGFGWFFVSSWIDLRLHAGYLTVGWALFGLFLFLLGFLIHERRQRWCGLGIVLAAILRVGLYDFWGFSTGYRILTFLVLTVVTLAVGFIYARFAERLKTWL